MQPLKKEHIVNRDVGQNIPEGGRAWSRPMHQRLYAESAHLLTSLSRPLHEALVSNDDDARLLPGFDDDRAKRNVARRRLAVSKRNVPPGVNLYPLHAVLMPRISAFYGIVTYMYWRDHPPPTFMRSMPNMKQK